MDIKIPFGSTLHELFGKYKKPAKSKYGSDILKSSFIIRHAITKRLIDNEIDIYVFANLFGVNTPNVLKWLLNPKDKHYGLSHRTIITMLRRLGFSLKNDIIDEWIPNNLFKYKDAYYAEKNDKIIRDNLNSYFHGNDTGKKTGDGAGYFEEIDSQIKRIRKVGKHLRPNARRKVSKKDAG